MIKLPPHEYRELVNELTSTAKQYSKTQQLREQMSTVLSKYVESDRPHNKKQVEMDLKEMPGIRTPRFP